ncbi:hypothetical protein DPM12_01445 [Phytoactinopolyspora halophila]|uniref:Uncharacterized protein n=1 Tax=Phytoactinopolyspora halophila TaxID=1981511 RepID=A0A329R2F9_9ACTN|nr:hypothetical protein DPM12_01445 [Phytoactinopolyspora halophila]
MKSVHGREDGQHDAGDVPDAKEHQHSGSQHPDHTTRRKDSTTSSEKVRRRDEHDGGQHAEHIDEMRPDVVGGSRLRRPLPSGRGLPGLLCQDPGDDTEDDEKEGHLTRHGCGQFSAQPRGDEFRRAELPYRLLLGVPQ